MESILLDLGSRVDGKPQNSTTYDGRHESILVSLFNTSACWASAASSLLLAFPTEILAKQPVVPTTLLSEGNTPPLPQVVTSGPLKNVEVYILLRTNWKSFALVQLVPAPAAGKFTFKKVPLGRNGAPEARRVDVTLVARSA